MTTGCRIDYFETIVGAETQVASMTGVPEPGRRNAARACPLDAAAPVRSWLDDRGLQEAVVLVRPDEW